MDEKSPERYRRSEEKRNPAKAKRGLLQLTAMKYGALPIDTRFGGRRAFRRLKLGHRTLTSA
jgi:hypothetical protein